MSNSDGYLKAIWHEAFGRTWDDFSDQFGKLRLLAYFSIVGLGFYVAIGAVTDVKAELANWAQALIAIGGATILLFLYRLLGSPYRIWKRDRETIQRLSEEIEVRRNWKAIGDELKDLHWKGTEFAHFHFGPLDEPAYSAWVTAIGVALSKCGETESALFETSTIGIDSDRHTDHRIYVARFQEHIKRVMTECYEKADAKESKAKK